MDALYYLRRHFAFRILLSFCLLVTLAICVHTQPTAKTVTTIAGTGPPDVGDGGPASQGVLLTPTGVVAGAAGSWYIVDTYNDRIRRVEADGQLSTIAGSGSAETQNLGDGGPATEAQLRFPRGFAIGTDGYTYIADTNHYVVRRVSAGGIITRFAGNRVGTFAGDGGLALAASFAYPVAVAVDGSGNVYIADQGANRVRRVGLDGVITTIAGNGTAGTSGDGGPAADAGIASPASLTFDSQNRLLIGTGGGIRRLDLATGIITTVTPDSAQHVAIDGQGRFVFTQGAVVKRLSEGAAAVTIAGTGTSGFSGDGGPASQAQLRGASGVAVEANGNILIADAGNHRVRRIRVDLTIETAAGTGLVPGDGVPAAQSVIYDSQGLAYDAFGNLYFTDFQQNTIRRLSTSGMVSTIAGNREPMSAGDGGHPLAASFSAPRALEFDPHGQLAFIDETSGVGTIRIITPGSDGVVDGSADERILRIAGQAVDRSLADRGSADHGPARNAIFDAARGFALDSSGNLYVSDWFDHRVRKVTPGADGVFDGESDEIITTIAGNGVAASTGNGGPAVSASVNSPQWMAVDPSDRLFLFEETNGSDRTIRRIDLATGMITQVAQGIALWSFAFDAKGSFYFATGTQVKQLDLGTGTVWTIAGTGDSGYSGDGGDALLALFRGPAFFAISSTGSIAAADNGNFRLRKISADFTDPSLAAGGSVVRTAHIIELRGRIDAVRGRLGRAAFNWTDPALAPASHTVKAVHLLELRTALNEAYAAANRLLPTYSDPTIVAGSTVVKAVHITELRSAVLALE